MNFSNKKYAALLCLVAVLHVRHARSEAAAPVATLTPKEALAWMAPLRIEDGRLDIDWATVGILSSSVAGLKQSGGKTVSEIGTDVKFNVALPGAVAGVVPELEVLLHVDGGTATANPFGAALRQGEIPIIARIAEKNTKDGLRGYLRARGLPIKDGAEFDISEIRLNMDSSTCLAIYEVTRQSREFNLRFKEERALKFELSINQSRNILLIRYENIDSSGGFSFTQKPGGEAELSFDKGATKAFVRGENLRQLVQKHTAEAQLNFFRPLADIGVIVNLSPWDPLESTCRHASLSIL